MEPRQSTIIILGVTALFFLVWDLYVAYFNRVPNKRDTITGVIFGWTFDRSIWVLPYAWGVGGGHLFLPREAPLVGTATGVAVMFWIGIVVWTAGRLYRHFMLHLPWQRYARFPWHMLGLLALGAAVGHFFVPSTWTW